MPDQNQKSRPYSRNWQGVWPKTPGRLLGVGLIRAYQLTLSGFIGNSCRFVPTCSEYAYEAVARFGLIRGSTLAASRVARCNPWFGGRGFDKNAHGHDPVPAQEET